MIVGMDHLHSLSCHFQRTKYKLFGLLIAIGFSFPCCVCEFFQFNCITVIPGRHITDNIQVSRPESSLTDCAAFCIDRDHVWLSASLHHATCHCHGRQFDILTNGTYNAMSSYLILNFTYQLTNCYEIYKCFSEGNGVYNILDLTFQALPVYCDMNKGGWTIVQRRYDGSVAFDRTFAEYQAGFGDVTGEYWLGLDNIYHMTKYNDYEVRFDLEDNDGDTRYATYDTFKISDVTNYYRITIEGYHGNAGDSMKTHNGMQFSAGIVDNDFWPSRCVDKFGGGGWWYNSCHNVNINGLYNNTEYGLGIIWARWLGFKYSLKSVSMKIRPKL